MFISKTYDIVTPESAEQGDVADSGFEFADVRVTEYRAQEIRKQLRDLACPRLNDWDHGGATVYADEAYIRDYRTAESVSEALHFTFESPAEARAFRKIWNRYFGGK